MSQLQKIKYVHVLVIEWYHTMETFVLSKQLPWLTTVG